MSMLWSTEVMQERYLNSLAAQDDLIRFARLSTPLPADRLNPRLSRYQWVRHHQVIARALERVASGEINRLEIELPPRHGKSELAIRQFAPWLMGKFPFQSGIVLCHTDSLAMDHGRDVRDYWQGPGFRLAFGDNPDAQLRTDSRASDRLQSVAGGIVTFSGRSALGAGVGGNWLLVDDLFKNSEEAASQTARESAWRAYNVDCKSRLNDESCPIVMIGSRRNEDDVQGRIFDPTSIHYDAKEAARWHRIRIPALCEGDGDPLGRVKDEPIWPEKFGREFFESMRNNASEVIRDDFQTQYQCNPRPVEGTWFKKSWLKTYRATELPRQLRYYVASDHAYRSGEKNDFTCLLVVGIDPTGAIYVLPDTWWKRAQTTEVVDAMFQIVQRRHPSMWWAARDAISGSLEPFIRVRMMDQKIFFPLDDSITESRDLVARSSSIRGMMAMGMVHWPADWPQWSEAENELLSFPGKHDDLCLAAGSMVTMADGYTKPIQLVKVGDVVKTQHGAQLVEVSECTGLHEVTRYFLSNGTYIDATPNHPIAIVSTSAEQEFVSIDALKMNHSLVTLDSCEKQKQIWSSSTERDTAVIQTQSTGRTAAIGLAAAPAEGFCIGIFGNITTAFQFLAGLMFTTRTKIRSTTVWIISNCCQRKFMLVSTCQSVQGLQNTLQGSPESDQMQRKPLADLEQRQNGKRFCQIAQSSNGRTDFTSRLKFNAARVLKSFSLRFQCEQKPVAQPASSVTVVSKKVLGLLPTFNLTVANEHVFFANGILTHNCAALAMLGMGIDKMVKAEGPNKSGVPERGTFDWHSFGQQNKKSNNSWA